MPVLEPWIPFALATLAFACMPGPAILYMTAQTLAYGRRAGLMAALGVHLGCYVHIAAAAIGLAALLEHAPALFTVIRLAGAAYLAWLGVTMFLSRSVVSDATARPKPNVMRDSIVVEILNPKTALFFLTFLPQFVDAADPHASQKLFFLGLYFIAINLPFAFLLILGAEKVVSWLKARPRVLRGIDFTFAGVFGLFAFKILTTQTR